MPSYHGRRISSVGLRMFSRSCSARIVGDSEVMQLGIVQVSTGVGLQEVIPIGSGTRANQNAPGQNSGCGKSEQLLDAPFRREVLKDALLSHARRPRRLLRPLHLLKSLQSGYIALLPLAMSQRKPPQRFPRPSQIAHCLRATVFPYIGLERISPGRCRSESIS